MVRLRSKLDRDCELVKVVIPFGIAYSCAAEAAETTKVGVSFVSKNDSSSFHRDVQRYRKTRPESRMNPFQLVRIMRICAKLNTATNY